eukprot:snap_masked-scaffold_1-processed-gene-2.22-mRNA-1 protein AED:1.00 eAED:1.00 QI:0/0/0/0/1/1/2/0/1670
MIKNCQLLLKHQCVLTFILIISILSLISIKPNSFTQQTKINQAFPQRTFEFSHKTISERNLQTTEECSQKLPARVINNCLLPEFSTSNNPQEFGKTSENPLQFSYERASLIVPRVEYKTNTIIENSFLKLTLKTYHISSYSFSPSIPSPTLRIQKGTKLFLNLTNNLHKNTNISQDSFELTAYLTNIHTHGLHISPFEDDPSIKISVGESRLYEFNVDANHAGGVHWYHPHIEHISEMTIAGGTAGLLVIEDEKSGFELPQEILNLERHFLVIMKIFPGKLSLLSKGYEGIYDFINGVYPRKNVLDVIFKLEGIEDGVEKEVNGEELGKEEFFVLVNGFIKPILQVNNREWSRIGILFLAGDDEEEMSSDGLFYINGCEVKLIAKDGVYLRKSRNMEFSDGDRIWLHAASRVEFLLKCEIDEDEDPFKDLIMEVPRQDSAFVKYAFPVMSFEVLMGSQNPNPVHEFSKDQFEIHPCLPSYLPDLRQIEPSGISTQPMAGKENFVRSDSLSYFYDEETKTMDLEILPFSFNFDYFRGYNLPNPIVRNITVIKQQQIYQFRLIHGFHPLHTHVFHMQLVDPAHNLPSARGSVYHQAGDYVDTFSSPCEASGCVDNEPRPDMEKVRFRLFTDKFNGRMLMHCHNMDHSDSGAVAENWVIADENYVDPEEIWWDQCSERVQIEFEDDKRDELFKGNIIQGFLREGLRIVLNSEFIEEENVVEFYDGEKNSFSILNLSSRDYFYLEEISFSSYSGFFSMNGAYYYIGSKSVPVFDVQVDHQHGLSYQVNVGSNSVEGVVFDQIKFLYESDIFLNVEYLIESGSKQFSINFPYVKSKFDLQFEFYSDNVLVGKADVDFHHAVDDLQIEEVEALLFLEDIDALTLFSISTYVYIEKNLEFVEKFLQKAEVFPHKLLDIENYWKFYFDINLYLESLYLIQQIYQSEEITFDSKEVKFLQDLLLNSQEILLESTRNKNKETFGKETAFVNFISSSVRQNLLDLGSWFFEQENRTIYSIQYLELSTIFSFYGVSDKSSILRNTFSYLYSIQELFQQDLKTYTFFSPIGEMQISYNFSTVKNILDQNILTENPELLFFLPYYPLYEKNISLFNNSVIFTNSFRIHTSLYLLDENNKISIQDGIDLLNISQISSNEEFDQLELIFVPEHLTKQDEYFCLNNSQTLTQKNLVEEFILKERACEKVTLKGPIKCFCNTKIGGFLTISSFTNLTIDNFSFEENISKLEIQKETLKNLIIWEIILCFTIFFILVLLRKNWKNKSFKAMLILYLKKKYVQEDKLDKFSAFFLLKSENLSNSRKISTTIGVYLFSLKKNTPLWLEIYNFLIIFWFLSAINSYLFSSIISLFLIIFLDIFFLNIFILFQTYFMIHLNKLYIKLSANIFFPFNYVESTLKKLNNLPLDFLPDFDLALLEAHINLYLAEKRLMNILKNSPKYKKLSILAKNFYAIHGFSSKTQESFLENNLDKDIFNCFLHYKSQLQMLEVDYIFGPTGRRNSILATLIFQTILFLFLTLLITITWKQITSNLVHSSFFLLTFIFSLISFTLIQPLTQILLRKYFEREILETEFIIPSGPGVVLEHYRRRRFKSLFKEPGFNLDFDDEVDSSDDKASRMSLESFRSTESNKNRLKKHFMKTRYSRTQGKKIYRDDSLVARSLLGSNSFADI